MNHTFDFGIAVASSGPHSEDRAEVFAAADALVVVVADGAGGVAGGASAAETLVDTVRSKLSSNADLYDVRAWSDVLLATDAHLASALAGETTGVVVVGGAHGVLAVSAGDSEAWVIASAGRIDRLTASQARQRLGSGRAKPAWCHRGSLDGLLVVASDGLFKHAAPEQVSSACTVSGAADAAQRLVELPRLSSGDYPDDVAVVVVWLR